jgi:hypothetical protein
MVAEVLSIALSSGSRHFFALYGFSLSMSMFKNPRCKSTTGMLNTPFTVL